MTALANEKDFATYLEAWQSGRFPRALDRRFFIGTVLSSAAKVGGPGFLCQLQIAGDPAADGGVYLSPNFRPQVGQVVEGVFIDAASGVILYPLSGQPTGPMLVDWREGAAATYDFQNIPQWGRLLEVKLYLRDTSAGAGLGAVTLTLNADTGANYFTEGQQIHGVAATAPTEALGAAGWGVFMAVGGGSPANLHSGGSLRVHGYSRAQLKACELQLFNPVATTTGNQNIVLHGMWWNNVAPVTRLTLTPAVGFDALSYAELWVS